MAAPWENYQNQAASQQSENDAPWLKYKPVNQPEPEGDWVDDVKYGVKEAGKSVAQMGVNAANIIPEVGDSIVSAAAWAGDKIGLGDGTYTPAMRFSLPEDMRPETTGGKIAAEVIPYLIPVMGPEKAAAALGTAADAGRLERGASKVADLAQENIIGALAQNSQRNDSGSLAADLGLGMTASGAARLVTPLIGKAYNAVSQKVGDILGRNPPPSGGGGAGDVETVLRQTVAEKNPDLASTLNGLDIRPRPDVVAAADRLGMTDDLLPSHLSGNQQYQAVEQGIKSRQGSILRVQEDQAIMKLAENAGKLIDDVAGVPDALSLNQKVIGQFDSRASALEGKSDQLYKRVDNAMPANARVSANNTAEALESKADELGGWENLDPIEKNVFKAVNPGQDGVLTYANLNKQRRLVGQALYKNRGPYKDADEGALKYLYRQLSEDQRAALGDIGARRDFEIAQRLVEMRKNMEDQMLSLRGKNLTGDIANKGSLAVASLAKGNSKQFIELMKNLPTRQMRQEVTGVAIRDMLSTGKRGAVFNPGGYADWYQNLRHSGNIRVLARHMPKEFMSGLHDTYVVANAIRNAKLFEVTTGKINEFTKRLDAVTAQYEFVAKHADKIGTMIGAKAGPLGAVVGGSFGAKVAAKARKLGGSESSVAAEKLIASPEFQQAAKGLSTPTPRGRSRIGQMFDEAKLRTSQAWREFYDVLPVKDKRIIARMGFLWWLMQEDQEEGQ